MERRGRICFWKHVFHSLGESLGHLEKRKTPADQQQNWANIHRKVRKSYLCMYIKVYIYIYIWEVFAASSKMMSLDEGRHGSAITVELTNLTTLRCANWHCPVPQVWNPASELSSKHFLWQGTLRAFREGGLKVCWEKVTYQCLIFGNYHWGQKVYLHNLNFRRTILGNSMRFMCTKENF